MSVTLIITVITVIVSIVAFRNYDIKQKLSFNPYKISHYNEYYRIITHAFIHGDWMHLLINIMVFISFGENVELYFYDSFGEKYKLFYTLLYFGGIVFSSFYGFLKHKDNIYYNAVGASGAVSAVLFTSVLYKPAKNVYFFGILPIPGILFAVLYLVYSYKMSQKSNDNIAHDAHFFGAIFGFVYPIVLKPQLFIDFIEELMQVF